MKHQRFFEYQDSLDGPWISVSAEELLFVLIPEGKAVAYRVIVVIL